MAAAVTPRIAVLPEGSMSFLRDAVEAGGAAVVDPEKADALVWGHASDVDGLRSVLGRGPGIRWVQLPWAGVERYAAGGIFDHDRVWTCAKQIYGEEVAEHALALGLAGMRAVAEFARAKTWLSARGRSLYDARVTILGAGGIAAALIDLLAPFRAEVTVVRRSAQPVAGAARTVAPDRLYDALAGADLVVVALALTPETEGIIDAKALAATAPYTWLVNVARGGHLVTDDLVEALRRDAIGGAALDVTDPEPLPDGHPLWDLPNCIITPHSANTPEMTRGPLSRLVTENVRRFGAGEELLGRVDPELGY
jgi:phosphoglycerate dehydrogenase-like enzyme